MAKKHMHSRRIGGKMLFTDGGSMEFERRMQERPGYSRPPKTARERDCPHCLYYCEKLRKCKEDKCIVFV